MAECIITRRTVSNKEIQWGDPVTITYNAPSSVVSYSSTLKLIESTNYPFFLLNGYTTSKGENTGSVSFTTTSTNMQPYFGDVQSWYGVGGPSTDWGLGNACTLMQTTSNGQVSLQWNRVNNGYWYAYGYYTTLKAVFINRYKCTGKEWFYKANVKMIMLG